MLGPELCQSTAGRDGHGLALLLSHLLPARRRAHCMRPRMLLLSQLLLQLPSRPLALLPSRPLFLLVSEFSWLLSFGVVYFPACSQRISRPCGCGGRIRWIAPQNRLLTQLSGFLGLPAGLHKVCSAVIAWAPALQRSAVNHCLQHGPSVVEYILMAFPFFSVGLGFPAGLESYLGEDELGICCINAT